MRTHRAVCLALAVALALTPFQVVAQETEELTAATPAFAEAYTGIPDARVLLDATGDVVAIGVPPEHMNLPTGFESRGKKGNPINCGISYRPPKFGEGDTGSEMPQDAFAPRGMTLHVYMVFKLSGNQGDESKFKMVRKFSGANKGKKNNTAVLEHGLFWLWTLTTDLFKNGGITTANLNVKKVGKCITWHYSS
jgi:hypothetical protein